MGLTGLGYLFTVLNYILYCTSRFMKDKKYILLLDLSAKFSIILGLYCLGSLTGAYNMAVSFIMLIVANLKERNEDKLDRRLVTLGFVIFQVAYILILIFTFKGISSVLVACTSSIALTCVWWLPPQKMRLLGLFNSCLFLSYQISIQNWAGLLEIAVLFSNLVAYYKYRRSTFDENDKIDEIDKSDINGNNDKCEKN